MSGFWRGKKVVVTGGAGFIGSYVAEQLLQAGAEIRVADFVSDDAPPNLAHILADIELVRTDLTYLDGARAACRGQEIIMNLAARTGSIKYNLDHPAAVFRDNTLMDLMVMEAARLEGAERFLVVSSSCVYPVDAPVPTPETAGFDGDPEPANYGYGWAKRLAEKKASMYEREFGLKAAIVRPYNGYGPRAVFDSETGHVVSALIKRIFDGDNPVVVWGDGNQRRTFLHASDFARGLILAVENYAECDPVNIGSDEEITIRELAELTVLLSGRDVELVFDDSKPSGMPRRHCDTTKAKQKIGFRAEVTLQDGLKDTIDWYRRTFSR